MFWFFYNFFHTSSKASCRLQILRLVRFIDIWATPYSSINHPIAFTDFRVPGLKTGFPCSSLIISPALLPKPTHTLKELLKNIFVVTSVASGSTFSGSLSVSGYTRFQSGVSASVFSGSGAGLTDIPFSALSQELFRIASGSVTASVSPNFGFIIESFDSGFN